MKKPILVIVILFSVLQSYAQKNSIWKKISSEAIVASEKIQSEPYSENQELFSINLIQFKQALENAKDKFSKQPGVVIDFPSIDGALESFLVWENSNFDLQLQQQFPNIKSYVGYSLAAKTTTIHFSLSPDGVQTMSLKAGNASEFLEPYTKDHSVYVLFDSETRTKSNLPFNCSTVDQRLVHDIANANNLANRADNQSYKTMRLAVSCTGEYGAYYGGTVAGALAGMNATMTRINGIFEKDLAIHLNIIATNNLVVYTNANSDPYSSASGIDNWNAELQGTLTSIIGAANYDIGHLFGATGGGGNAGCIGCVCGTNKGSAYTAPSNGIPAGDSFDIDYVIHEMGHQLGANHTFSHNTEGSGVNVEPGSGSTIMGYAGITNYDVQNSSDAYFAYRSILQIQTNLATKTCPVSTTIVNTPPTVAVGVDVTIPNGTAFLLKGVVSDNGSGALSYCWEQNNSAGSGATGANSVASPTKTTGPNFRSFTPTNSPNRYMPAYSSVLAGNLSSMWESVNTNARTSRYTLTVRDNDVVGEAQTKTDEITVTTSGTAGPFKVTSQNTAGISWAVGSAQTISWDVNNTNTLSGSSNVNIKLSIDGGQTFPYTLATATPNDGTEVISVPNVPASLNCRLWIEPTDNIYFAINSNVFFIGYAIVNTCTTYRFTTPFALNDGTTSFTSRTINVPVSGVISDVNITVNATHPNLQNLVIAVVRPGGSLATIYNQQCSGSANMNMTFDSQGAPFACGSPTEGTYLCPTGYNLNLMNGSNSFGNWQFGFRDAVAGNAGTINSIDLEICGQTFQLLSTTEVEFENFALYPNPNKGTFTVQFASKSKSKIAIEVYDMRGRTIVNKLYANTGFFNEVIALDIIEPGVYLVSISDGNTKTIKKISIQ